MMGIAKFALLFVSLTASGQLWSAQAYSTGAPTEVCEDMLPQHGAPVQTKESPYVVTVNRKAVKAGETITLTIASKDQVSKFKGFMVQARDGSGKPVGEFASMTPSKSSGDAKNKWKLISCPKGNTVNNTATHFSAVEKSRIVLTWTAPKDLHQSFKFKYTVAKNGGEYWVGKETESIAATGPSVAKHN